LIDPPLGWAAVSGRRRMWGVARESLWKHPLLAYLLDSMGAIPVKRHTADRNALRQAIEILQMGETIGMFPEGTRSPDGKLLPAQPGIALMVQRSRAPVIPVTVIGPYEMLPRHRKWPRRVPLTIIFGPPICFGPEATREQICARIMEAMATQMTAHGYPMEPPSPERAALAPKETD
ncbi:MAG: lysophospholipid acyltransferase family protein, partial [Chloroherpetonaceae bacterium]|nr:1-acyl-sn-glycerol-3-phosphate acyltransferase [Chthonomonadaceae bacterium]MDW8209264.1 lysophospholipid acyltransferase family protein [Chloroherpetonaceae bacterium]